MLIASTEWELPAVSSVTRHWLRLTCARGTCAAQHRAEGHPVCAAQHGTAQPAPAQVSCDVAHSSLHYPSTVPTLQQLPWYGVAIFLLASDQAQKFCRLLNSADLQCGQVDMTPTKQMK